MSYFQNLDWTAVLEKLSLRASSAQGTEFLRQLEPFTSQPETARRLQNTAEFIQVLKPGIRPRMESLDLFMPWYTRIEKGAVLKTIELRDVRHFCLEAVSLKEVFKDVTSEYIQDLSARMMPAEEPLSAIDQIITPSGDIRTDASEALYRLTSEKAQLARQIHIVLDRTVKDFRIEHLLQDKFVTTREGRWVLPVQSGQQHFFDGIIHDSSQSKQTVFMEPQGVVPLNNRLREVESEIEQEIERLLADLSHYLKGLRNTFLETKNILFESDLLFSMAQFAIEINGVAPRFSSGELDIKEIRHPLLVLNKADVIPNSVQLNAHQHILILSGPNAGGKTVLLKSIGLCAQMSRCGLFIPAAEGSQLPFFENILVSVGDAQSVDANLSTFAAHLKTMDQATRLKGKGSLLLVDEICGSTDPDEGAALARGFVEIFRRNQVFAVITSHLGELKKGWEEGCGVINGSLEFDPKKGPTYRFLLGVAGQSLAIQTAKRVGVFKDVIDLALSYLSPDVLKYQKNLEEVEKMKEEIFRIEEKLRLETRKMTEEKNHYEKLLQNFEIEKEQLLQKELKKAQSKIDELIQTSKVEDVFKRHTQLQKIKYELPVVVEAKSAHPVFQNAEDFLQTYTPGTTVYIQSLNREGVIQGKANAKDEIPILSGSMRLSVHFRDLRERVSGVSPTRHLVKKAGIVTGMTTEIDRVLDLRGLTSEEAISQIEIQLDAASLHGEDRIKIVHGHGTDSLKRTVRGYLSRSVYVKKWYAGTPDSGGDGLTWVELK